MEKVNVKELGKNVAERLGLNKAKDGEEVVNAILQDITDALVDGKKVVLGKFGTFEVKERSARAERNGRNPATQEPMIIPAKPAKNVPKFKAGKQLSEAVL